MKSNFNYLFHFVKALTAHQVFRGQDGGAGSSFNSVSYTECQQPETIFEIKNIALSQSYSLLKS